MTIVDTDTSNLLTRLQEQARAARVAARVLAALDAETKNHALRQMEQSLLDHEEEILQANARDVEKAAAAGAKQSFLDRLRLTPERLREIASALRVIVDLPDPIGVVQERWQLNNGMRMEKISVPLGVIAMIYEARPNVTVDAVALTFKTGNAVILRGSADALESNKAIVAALQVALRSRHLPEEAVQLVDAVEHVAVDYLVRMKSFIDLVVPRGGAGLIRSVVDNARVPVIETGVGICHVYVDVDADPDLATRITVNSKTQRTSVCNAAETLLVHEAIAPGWLPQAVAALRKRGVEVRGCERTRALVPDVVPADEQDWETEYLDLILSVKIVADVQEAIDHIERYGSQHTETIVTRNADTAALFLQRVDSSAVYHNASTRLTDGFVYGFGAEIGISTQKLHARGPMGLQALTSYKYIGYGDGQLR